MAEKIKGVVENIRYYVPTSGYTVMEIATVTDGGQIVVGNFPKVNPGEEVIVSGEWVTHPKYGIQFKGESIEQTMPSDLNGIRLYLSSGVIKGVGEKTAQKIVKAFGKNTFDVLENDPARLAAEIHGITKTKAKLIQQEFKSQAVSRDVIVKLRAIGLTQKEALAAYDLLGDTAAETITLNPFVFVSEYGYSYNRALTIVENLPNAVDLNFKCRAVVTEIVRFNSQNEGHTCLPRDKVKKTATEHVKAWLDGGNKFALNEGEEGLTQNEIIDARLDEAIEYNTRTKQLTQQSIDGRKFLFLPDIFEAEKGIAERMKIMVNYPPKQSELQDREIATFEKINGIQFDEAQKKAIEIAVIRGILILTGGPGTGKTTTVKGIIRLMKQRGLKVKLTAPTGRAAQRMTELTGYDAETIHRMLEVEYDEGGKHTFVHNRKNPLKADAIIVDEMSMVDATLFNSLLEAMPLSARLIMVGDTDQLPPVGAGAVLKDLIKSEIIPVVHLSKIFRQAEKSHIVTNAHRVVNGEMPVFANSEKNADFFMMHENVKSVAAGKIVDIVTNKMPNFYGFDPVNDIQVLSPTLKGEVGTENLNNLLQAAINPPSIAKQEYKCRGYVLREGDKVMQVKNNYDVPWEKVGAFGRVINLNDEPFRSNSDDGPKHGSGVFNGDIGIISRIDKRDGEMQIKFDNRLATYSFENVNEIKLAYAMTVHKSQGSEFTAVIMPVLDTSPKLCYRNLFYTAITRAKSLILLIGKDEDIKKMVENDKEIKRYSALNYFIHNTPKDNLENEF